MKSIGAPLCRRVIEIHTHAPIHDYGIRYWVEVGRRNKRGERQSLHIRKSEEQLASKIWVGAAASLFLSLLHREKKKEEGTGMWDERACRLKLKWARFPFLSGFFKFSETHPLTHPKAKIPRSPWTSFLFIFLKFNISNNEFQIFNCMHII